MTDNGLLIEHNRMLADIDLSIQDVVGDKYPFSTSVQDFEELLKNINLSLEVTYEINLFNEIEILEYILEKYLVRKSAERIKKNLEIFITEDTKQDKTKQDETKQDEIKQKEYIPYIKSEQEKFEEQIVIPDHIQYLLSLPQPEQKSQAWLDQRQNYITASVFGEACGMKGPTTLVTLLLNKISYGKFQPFHGNKATQWGEKYEDVANMIYGYRNLTKVYEFGMIPHPDLPFLGASTDGVSAEMINIEIKCPYSRFITGIPPPHYWAQMQLQMATLDLDKTHFLECTLQEYPTEEAFFDDFEWIEEDQFRIPVKGDQITFRKPPPPGHHAEKGLLIEVVNLDQENLAGEPKTIYLYSPIEYYLDKEKLKLWRDMKIYEITHSKNLIFIRVIPWVLARLSCVEVDRDQEWFDAQIPILKEFWKDVELYRKQNLSLDEISSLKDRLIDKYMNFGEENSNSSSRRSRTSSPNKKKTMQKDSPFYNEIKSMGCILDSDDEVGTNISSNNSKTKSVKVKKPSLVSFNKFSGCMLDDDNVVSTPKTKTVNKTTAPKKTFKKLPTSVKAPSKCLLEDSDDESPPPKKQTTAKSQRQKLETTHIKVQTKPNQVIKSPIKNKVCLL